MNALRLTAFAAALALGTISAHADTIKQRPLSMKEAMLEAQRQVQKLADQLRESDRRAAMGNIVIDAPYTVGPTGSQTSAGNAAGKR